MSAIYDAIATLEDVKKPIFGQGPINPLNVVPFMPNMFRANYLGPLNDLSDDYIKKHPPTGFADGEALTHDQRYNLSEKTKKDDPDEASLIQRGADLRMVHNIRKHLDDPNAGFMTRALRTLHPQTQLGLRGIQLKMLVEDKMGHIPKYKGQPVPRSHDVIPGYRRGTGLGGIPVPHGRERQTVMIHNGEIVLTRGDPGFPQYMAKQRNRLRQ